LVPWVALPTALPDVEAISRMLMLSKETVRDPIYLLLAVAAADAVGAAVAASVAAADALAVLLAVSDAAVL
jgi:hypothetical protein